MSECPSPPIPPARTRKKYRAPLPPEQSPQQQQIEDEIDALFTWADSPATHHPIVTGNL